jgi:Tfp pilus assembly protein PilF
VTANHSEVAGLLAEVAYYLIRKQEIERAQVVLQGLKELQPQQCSPLVLEGLCHFAKLDFPAAEKSYRAGLDKEAENDLAKAFLAESLIAQRRYREAEDLLRKVISRKSDQAAVTLAQSLDEGLRQGLFQRE